MTSSCRKSRSVELYRDVDVPEWKVTVRLKKWSLAERDQIESILHESQENLTAKILVFTLCNKRRMLFSLGDVEPLGEKSSKILNSLLLAAIELNRGPSGPRGGVDFFEEIRSFALWKRDLPDKLRGKPGDVFYDIFSRAYRDP